MSLNNIVDKHLVGVRITGELLAAFITDGETRTIRVKSPLSDMAVFMWAYFEHSHNSFVCVFDDPTHPQTLEGQPIPILTDEYCIEVTELLQATLDHLKRENN